MKNDDKVRTTITIRTNFISNGVWNIKKVHQKVIKESAIIT